MYSMRLTVGTGFKGDGSPLTAPERKRALSALETEILAKFGGFTSSDGFGVWRDPHGRVHKEPSRTYDIATDDDPGDAARMVAALARDRLQQQAVLLRISREQGSFI